MTTIHRRSFSGPELTHFASALLVCVGLVLLFPEPVSSDRVALSEEGTSVCAESPHGPRDQQWRNGDAVDVPDFCDDEDDDDDRDDESSGGSGQAIAVSKHIPTNHNDASPLIYVGNDAHGFRSLDAPSLRGPPAVHQESSDADFDDDDDDESLRAHRHVLIAPANRREPHVPARGDGFHAASPDAGHALRAPPQ